MAKKQNVSYWSGNEGKDFKMQAFQLVKHMESLTYSLDTHMHLFHADPSLEGPLIETDLSQIREDMEKIMQYKTILSSSERGLLYQIQDKLFQLSDPTQTKFEISLNELIFLIEELKKSLQLSLAA